LDLFSLFFFFQLSQIEDLAFNLLLEGELVFIEGFRGSQGLLCQIFLAFLSEDEWLEGALAFFILSLLFFGPTFDFFHLFHLVAAVFVEMEVPRLLEVVLLGL